MVILVVAALCATNSFAINCISDDDLDFIDPGEITVEVAGINLGGCSYASISCNGTLRTLAADGDTVSSANAVGPDVALDLVNELLYLNFMDMPPHYDSIRQVLKPEKNRGLQYLSITTSDAGLFTITLRVRDKVHTVSVNLPAPSAPEALREWIPTFWGVVKN
jgi:hypothetical protein